MGQSIEISQLLIFGLTAHTTVTALESLADRSRYTEHGILSWNVAKLQYDRKIVRQVLTRCFRGSRFVWILILHLLAGILLLGSIISELPPLLPLVILFCTTVLIGLRHHAGLNGDYDISLVIVVGLLLWASHTNIILPNIGFVFIGVQTLLSYLISGTLKLFSAEWRSGEALTGIFSARMWGSERVYTLLEANPFLAKLLSWMTISFECLFPVFVVAPRELLLGILLLGALFHISTAALMGLNRFAIVFPATYPAVYYLNLLV